MQTVAVYVIVFLALVVAVFYFVRRLRAFVRRNDRAEGCEGCPLRKECGKINKTSASGEGCGCSSCGCTKESE